MFKIHLISLIFVLFVIQPVFSEDVSIPPSSHSWENCVVFSDGNSLYAVSRANSRPLWSDSGLFYREAFDFDDFLFASENQRKKRRRPTQMFASHLVQEGRLYVLLNRSAFGPERGNVLAAFDLTQEGKILWRLAWDEKKYSQRLRFESIETLQDGRLTVYLSDQALLRIDAATGAILTDRF